MTVVLLDPQRPDLIPMAAVALLSGPVQVTEDVPPTFLWELDNASAAAPDAPADLTVTLLTTDRDHPLVQRHVAAGDRVVGDARPTGHRLVDAVALMDTLRRNGPWERRQTHQSLRTYLLEECYELLDAIDNGTPGELCGELGDMLLQVLFHARIAQDAEGTAFDIDDVASAFITKVAGRTPGILSGEHSDLETQIAEWEERKAAERERGSVLDGIVTSQPALALAQKVFNRLQGAGFPDDHIPTELTTVSVLRDRRDQTSAEDELRSGVVAFMEQVYAVEARAKVDGVGLESEDAWRGYLEAGQESVSGDDSDADDPDEQPAAERDDGPTATD